jgi:uncharacterized protein DUF2844
MLFTHGPATDRPWHLCASHPHRILEVGYRNQMGVPGFGKVEGMKRRFDLSILLLGAFMVSSSTARAVLGQPVASVENDRASLRGELKVIPGEGFSIRQITTAEGTVVKEYVSPSGVVFGVSWRGPVFPDLSELLGTYFPQFQQGASIPHPFARRHLLIHTHQLVAETGGHMRDLRGRAYVPALLPAEVSAASIE